MGQRGRNGPWEVVVIARRERRSSGFSPMTPLGGRATEMATRQCSSEAAGGASMGRWFWARGGEIGTGLGAVDNEVISSCLL
jgi:hypothetical protein